MGPLRFNDIEGHFVYPVHPTHSSICKLIKIKKALSYGIFKRQRAKLECKKGNTLGMREIKATFRPKK